MHSDEDKPYEEARVRTRRWNVEENSRSVVYSLSLSISLSLSLSLSLYPQGIVTGKYDTLIHSLG